MRVLIIVTVLVGVCCAQLGDIMACLTCCGKSPCCNTCGLDINVFKPLKTVRRAAVVGDSLADLFHNGGISLMCPECCGPPPCCNTCGMDFNNLKNMLLLANTTATKLLEH